MSSPRWPYMTRANDHQRLRRHWRQLRRGLPLDTTAMSISNGATTHPARVPVEPAQAAKAPGRAEYTALHRAPCPTPPTSPASLCRDVHGHAEHAVPTLRPEAWDTAIDDHDTAHHAAVAGLFALSGHTPASAAPPPP